MTKPHTCVPDHGVGLRKKIYTEAKNAGIENLTSSGKSIVQELLLRVVEEDQNAVLPKMNNVINSTNRKRAGQLPKNPNPKDILFDIKYDKIPEGLQLVEVPVGKGKNAHRHLIFYTQHSRELLKVAKRWCFDGTFKIRKKPFQQLFSIHVHIRRDEEIKSVPVLFTFMTRRHAKDYKAVLRAVKKLIPGQCWIT